MRGEADLELKSRVGWRVRGEARHGSRISQVPFRNFSSGERITCRIYYRITSRICLKSYFLVF